MSYLNNSGAILSQQNPKEAALLTTLEGEKSLHYHGVVGRYV